MDCQLIWIAKYFIIIHDFLSLARVTETLLRCGKFCGRLGFLTLVYKLQDWWKLFWGYEGFIVATQNPIKGNFGERSQIVQWHRNMVPHKMTIKMVDLWFLAFQGNEQVLLWYSEFDNGFPRKLKLIVLFFPQQNIWSQRGREHEIWQSKRAPGRIGE